MSRAPSIMVQHISDTVRPMTPDEHWAIAAMMATESPEGMVRWHVSNAAATQSFRTVSAARRPA